ncbi:hypothetical protein [Demequina muriae]|uniref:Uncharacterized protein n=1 Tax=Demequina muriae TaxID=3051664 RepID=A0ABT8GGG8_9MICO|nr:hypothetical protein [Demequina sp. EGI L300058]MDN4480046.1 hypothetical protein [Demequina sp. EGI L300058]
MADFTGGPGLLAFIATFTMVLAAVLLFRSLSKHLRKVRTHPPEGDSRVERRADEPPRPDDADTGERD